MELITGEAVNEPPARRSFTVDRLARLRKRVSRSNSSDDDVAVWFKDVSVTAKKSGTILVESACGYFKRGKLRGAFIFWTMIRQKLLLKKYCVGQLTAVMGPSGSGKVCI